MNSTLFHLSSGCLTVALVVLPAQVSASPRHLESHAPQVQSMIEEWHWRDMDH